MRFFNMQKVLTLTGNKTYKIKEVMKSKKISGSSFLLNEKDLLASKEDDFYIASYLYLASFRNYSDYYILGIKDLDLSYIPDIDLERYKTNPLLTITNKTIKFKYE